MKPLLAILIAGALGIACLASGCATPSAPRAGTSYPVDSELLRAVHYDDITEELTLTFKNRDVYRYEAVPPHVYDALMASRSKGKYYTKRIKDRFEGSKR